jgi:hypothetical protein
MAASAGSFLMALLVTVAFTAFAGFTAFSTVFSVFAAKLVAHLRSDRHIYKPDDCAADTKLP